MPRIDRDLFFVDTETTGLDHNFHEILQVAVIKTSSDGKEIREKYSARLKPRFPDRIDPKAAAVNGYKAEDYTNSTCAPPEEVAKKLIRLSNGCIPVGQNVKFDLAFLTAFFLQTGGLRPTWHYHSLDTMNLAWPFFIARKIDYFNLDTLCDYFRVERPKVHNAIADIEATHEVFLKLLDQLQVVTP